MMNARRASEVLLSIERVSALEECGLRNSVPTTDSVASRILERHVTEVDTVSSRMPWRRSG